MSDPVPYDELDPNIVSLVRALNAFDGVHTIGSCGGHTDAEPGQWEEGEWYVKFRLDRTDAGWRSLEFLAWIINNDLDRARRKVMLCPVAPPPWLNEPGNGLSFVVEGFNHEDPNEVASFAEHNRQEFYVRAQNSKR